MKAGGDRFNSQLWPVAQGRIIRVYSLREGPSLQRAQEDLSEISTQWGI